MPPFSKIDKLNKTCYNAIADEYDSKEHKTCRDFDKFNEIFLKECFNKLFHNRNIHHYVDIGVGTGKSLELAYKYLNQNYKNFSIDVIDISDKMLNIVKEKFNTIDITYHNTSIFSYKSTQKYDLIISTLCDPFLTNEYIKVLSALISNDGIILLTFPTKSFAKKIRNNLTKIEYTIFHDKNKNEFKSYSFCWDDKELNTILKKYGFEIIHKQNYPLNEYKHILNSNLLLNNKEKENYIILSGIAIKKQTIQ